MTAPQTGYLLPDARARRWSERLFFGLLLLLGVWLVDDYGVSWDEPNNHLNGLVSLKYVASLLPVGDGLRQHPTFATTPDIRQFKDAHHGPLFEMVVVVVSYLFTDHDSRSYFLVRHLLVFAVFGGGVWAVYQLGRRWLRSWRWGLLVAALLVASPRIFAEAFYNGKDIVFMACFALAMHTLLRLLARPTVGQAVGHGLAIAVAVDIRVQGLQLLLFTGLALALAARAAQRQPLASRPAYGCPAAIAVATALVGTVAGWPYLWAHSLPELLATSSQAVRYSWGFTTLYLGDFLKASALPWHYIPLWMLLTIPLPYVLAAGWGLWHAAGRASSRASWRVALAAPAGPTALLLALWLLAPVGLVMMTHAVVYDGWRHLYFVYPALLLWAGYGLRALLRLGRRPGGRVRTVARLALALAALETGHTLVRMVGMHPHGNLYFSFLSAPAAERLFERDYWGLSYRQGLEWLLARQGGRGPVRVNVSWPHYLPLSNNILMLPAAQRPRIQYVPLAEADYYMGAYRWHPQAYPDSVGTEIYTLRVEGIKTLSIFRRPRAIGR